MKTNVFTRLLGTIVALIVCALMSCSIPDGADMGALKTALHKLSPYTIYLLRHSAMNRAASAWLKTRPKNDLMLWVECRERGQDLVWSEWQRAQRVDPLNPERNTLEVIVDQFLAGIIQRTKPTYMEMKMAFDVWKATDEAERRELSTSKETECRQVWDHKYDPDHIDEKITNPDKVTDEDMIEVMIDLPTPPVGFGLEEIEELGPLLCPLGAGPGWGCPSDPTQPPGADK